MITDMTSEDIEERLLRHCDVLLGFVQGDPLALPDVAWMRGAIEELRLRRLARSAG